MASSLLARAAAQSTGVEYVVKSCEIPESGDVVDLHLFDSPGSDVFTVAAEKMWGEAAFVIFVYDVTNEASFKTLDAWMARYKAKAHTTGTELCGAVLANKTDLAPQRVVDAERGQQWAEKNRLKFYEVSAKNGDGLDYPFSTLAQEFRDKYFATIDEITAAAAP